MVHGNAGNDRITIDIGDTGNTAPGGNPAGNAAYGDGGNDTLLFQLSARAYAEAPWLGAPPTGTVSLYGGAGDDVSSVEGYFVGGMPGMTVNQYGGDGNDKLHATTDVWEPDGSFSGGDNTDKLYGGAGDDTYFVCEAKDTVFEDANGGIDKVVAHQVDYVLPANVEHLQMTGGYYPYGQFHGTGNDLANVMTVDEIPAYVGDLSYVFDGKGGNDTISGFAQGGDDTILGGDGNDTLYGRAVGDSDGYYSDADTIHGGSGNDLIYGGSGKTDSWDSDDTLYGEDGNDRIWGSFGNDLMSGGKGSDQLRGQAGNDILAGGEGGRPALWRRRRRHVRLRRSGRLASPEPLCATSSTTLPASADRPAATRSTCPASTPTPRPRATAPSPSSAPRPSPRPGRCGWRRSPAAARRWSRPTSPASPAPSSRSR